MGFDEKICYNSLLKGDLRGAMDYVRQFPEQEELYQKYWSVFEEEHYPPCGGDGTVQAILLNYQKYYRDVFYLRLEPEQAERNLRDRFARLFGIADETCSYEDMEEREIAAAFRERSLHFLGGRTGGFFGPYVWSETERRRYDVELPGGHRDYEVDLLSGFLSKSWLDFLTFGRSGTGGWIGQDGIINCVRDAYDLEGESFCVSLLKHEAQHAQDLSRFPDMSSEDLEYRAKLVELICSKERRLLERFWSQGGTAQPQNGHVIASARIAAGFEARLAGRAPQDLSTEEVQAIARELLAQSDTEVAQKYGGCRV